jgi:hypothetical protein
MAKRKTKQPTTHTTRKLGSLHDGLTTVEERTYTDGSRRFLITSSPRFVLESVVEDVGDWLGGEALDTWADWQPVDADDERGPWFVWAELVREKRD